MINHHFYFASAMFALFVFVTGGGITGVVYLFKKLFAKDNGKPPIWKVNLLISAIIAIIALVIVIDILIVYFTFFS